MRAKVPKRRSYFHTQCLFLLFPDRLSGNVGRLLCYLFISLLPYAVNSHVHLQIISTYYKIKMPECCVDVIEILILMIGFEMPTLGTYNILLNLKTFTEQIPISQPLSQNGTSDHIGT